MSLSPASRARCESRDSRPPRLKPWATDLTPASRARCESRDSRYPGHGKELADGWDAVQALFETLHAESMLIFSSLSDEDLQRKCITPNGSPITVWKWLRSMVEHEIHHRAQIYTYLAMLGVKTPPLYGLTSEQVHALSQ